LEANRRNAQLSTGPRTAEGKAAVSQNPVTHGLRARHAVLLIENRAEFTRLCVEMYDEWNPLSPTEIHLVEDMAVTRWKQRRLELLESNCYLQMEQTHIAYKDPMEFRTEKGTIRLPNFVHKQEENCVRMLNTIQRHQARLERSYYRALEGLQRLQAKRPQCRPQSVIEEVPVSREEAAAGGLPVETLGDNIDYVRVATAAGSSHIIPVGRGVYQGPPPPRGI
jgi:hypothetical protein